ncbi:HAD family hydrolase [Calidifontibacter terrae]
MSPAWPVVLFDFDGTLADTIALIVDSYHHTLSTAGLPAVDEVEVRSWIGRPLQPVFEQRYPGRGEELTAVYREWNLDHHDALIRPVEGITDLLHQLRNNGVQLGVVSSKRTDLVEQGLAAVGLDTAISVLAGMDDTTSHKPDPAPLLHAATTLSARPEDCVYVGDADVDILAARAAGMASIGVTWGAGDPVVLRGLRPNAVVDSAPRLRELLLS